MGTKTVLTMEDFERLPEDGNLHELNEGELVSVTRPSLSHTSLVSRIQRKLAEYVWPRNLGELHVEGGFVLSRDPPTLRSPDLAFITSAQLGEQDGDGWYHGAPALAIEVVSPSEPARDLEKKVRQYLAAGARHVWVIYPATKTVHAFDGNRGVRVLTESDTLDAADLFPGWSVKVADLLS